MALWTREATCRVSEANKMAEQAANFHGQGVIGSKKSHLTLAPHCVWFPLLVVCAVFKASFTACGDHSCTRAETVCLPLREMKIWYSGHRNKGLN